MRQRQRWQCHREAPADIAPSQDDTHREQPEPRPVVVSIEMGQHEYCRPDHHQGEGKIVHAVGAQERPSERRSSATMRAVLPLPRPSKMTSPVRPMAQASSGLYLSSGTLTAS